jgi:hypothetical protein
MVMTRYTKAVGRKFNADGAVRRFPGNSIICPISPEDDLYHVLVDVQESLKQLTFSNKYALLPPSSFHMTVMDLICDQVREADKWSDHLPLNASLARTDQYFIDQTESMVFPTQFQLHFTELSRTGVSLYFKPADASQAQSLSEFRDAIAVATGVRHPNHQTYRFHVSIAYQIIELTPAEDQVLSGLVTQTNQELRAVLADVTLSDAQLAFFDDMNRFVSVDEIDTLTGRLHLE